MKIVEVFNKIDIDEEIFSQEEYVVGILQMTLIEIKDILESSFTEKNILFSIDDFTVDIKFLNTYVQKKDITLYNKYFKKEQDSHVFDNNQELFINFLNDSISNDLLNYDNDSSFLFNIIVYISDNGSNLYIFSNSEKEYDTFRDVAIKQYDIDIKLFFFKINYRELEVAKKFINKLSKKLLHTNNIFKKSMFNYIKLEKLGE